MRTQRVASVELDPDRLAKELQLAGTFPHSEAYSNYLVGGPWKSWMLWARGGEGGDGVLTNYSYDRPAAPTEIGRNLPYLQEIIAETVDPNRITFVRLAAFADAVIVPHRDLIELADLPADARTAHRLHLPLATNEHCFFSEDNSVYRMGEGEVWFFDASRIHSVASLTTQPRHHLIVDFVETDDPASLVTVPRTGDGGIPADSTIARPPLPDERRAVLTRLADLITTDIVRDVLGIVTKTHFRFDGGDEFVWDTLTAVARGCPDPEVREQVLDMKRYFTLERSA